jgi:anti-sigma factor RsiW
MSLPAADRRRSERFADNRLADERARQIAAVLERDPRSRRVAEIRRLNAQLRDALDPWLAEPAARTRHGAKPALLVARCPCVARAGRRRVAGCGRRHRLAPRRDSAEEGTADVQRQAALTHALYAADANRPVEIWANEEERLVRWLSKRLSFPLHAPNLNSAGFALVGGRLVAGNEKPGALFMYENADKQRISLLVRKDAQRSRETAFRYAQEDGVSVFYWIDDACGYALSGNIDKQHLLSIARSVYGQLAVSEAPAPQN